MHLCHLLADRFSEEIDFEFSWWKHQYLLDPDVAWMAGQTIVRADLIIISTHTGQDLSMELKTWMDEWLPQRELSEGALAVLLQNANQTRNPVTPLGSYLRNLAQRAGMDYMSLAKPVEVHETFDSIFQRANRVTPLLDNILHTRHPSAHWGINE